MNKKLKKIIKKEKILWHNHFIPSLITGIIVGLVFFAWETTTSNIILFASLGASAITLANSKSHHLFKLRTVILSYLLSGAVAFLLYIFNLRVFEMDLAVNIFILIFVTGLLQFLTNLSHPTAISASIAFILLEGSPIVLIYTFIVMIPCFVLVRLFAYVISQHLTVKEFFKEFKKRV